MKSLIWIVHSYYLTILTSVSIKYHSVVVVLIVAFLLFARKTMLEMKDHDNYHEFPETGRDRLEHRLGRGGLFVFGYDENYAVL